MKRREFITLLGSSAVAWPLAARAQQDGRVRRVGVLMTTATDDPEGQARLAAFLQGLQQLGWIDGRNARIDARWAAGNSDYTRKYAAELPRSHRTSSWPLAASRWGRCCRRPAPCRLCSCMSPIRSGPASSPAWRGRAAMPPVSTCSNTPRAANGWNCSKRSHRV